MKYTTAVDGWIPELINTLSFHKEQDRNFKKARDLIKEFETKKKRMEDSIQG